MTEISLEFELAEGASGDAAARALKERLLALSQVAEVETQVDQSRGVAEIVAIVSAGVVLIDQGTADQFLDLLRPEALAGAMAERRQGGTFRMQKGYDHSYFFISTFMEDHIAFHANALHGA